MSLLAQKTHLSEYLLVFQLLLCFIFDKCSLALLVNRHDAAVKHFFPFIRLDILPFHSSVSITSGLSLPVCLRYKL